MKKKDLIKQTLSDGMEPGRQRGEKGLCGRSREDRGPDGRSRT